MKAKNKRINFDDKNNIFSERTKINSYKLYKKRRRKRYKRFSKAFFIIFRLFLFVLIISLSLLILIKTISHYKYNKYNIINKNFHISSIKNRSFFFEENQDELKYCQNFGILVYNYYYGGKFPSEIAANIGDYIQSLAALQFMPKNCKPYFIDREEIQLYNGTKVKLIMAGWHALIKTNQYVPVQIEPIFTTYHINTEKLPNVYVENLKKYAPIGCRDLKTRDQFIKYGINAYFSSCLSTTLDIDYAANENERTDEIIFIDYKFGNYPPADKFILSLKAYNFHNITYIDHHFKIKLTHVERFQLAKKLLDKYARAKLIISTRLHGALPCLAFNTPVILVNKGYDPGRYPGLYELLNTIGINQDKRFEIRVNVNNEGFVYNSERYLEFSKKLKDYLKNI